MLWPLRLLFMLLLALLLVAWLRSYRFVDGIEITGPGGSFVLTSHPGRLRVCWPSRLWTGSRKYHVDAFSSPRAGAAWEEEWKGDDRGLFHLIFSPGAATFAGRQIRFVDISFWSTSLLAGIWPALFFIGRIRKGWRMRGGRFCRVCEYDLRGTPERCPECGTSVKPIPFRRRLAALLIYCGILAGALFGGRWLELHDFSSTLCRNMDFATLGDFAFDQYKGKLAEIPFPIRLLDGRKIAIEGYMIPMDQAEKITEFALVPDIFWSHRRGPPPIQQTIVARIVSGPQTGYFADRIRVTGTLHVRVTYDEGYVVCIFDMTVDSIQRPLR